MEMSPEMIADWYFVTKHQQKLWTIMEFFKKIWFEDDGVHVRFLIGDYGELADAKRVMVRRFRPDVIDKLVFKGTDILIPWDQFWDELIKPNTEFVMELYENNSVPNNIVESRWDNNVSLVDYYDQWYLNK